MQCDLCQRASLLRRGQNVLCPHCYAYEEWYFCKGIANNPFESKKQKRKAQQRIQRLRRLIVELNQQPAATKQKEAAAA